jgi:D-alanine transaminase
LVRDGIIVAPPKDNQILPGITYDVAFELAREGGFPIQVRPVPKDEALAADEMWLSSSTKEVLAVTSLDRRPFGGGKPGPLFRKVHALFQASKAA